MILCSSKGRTLVAKVAVGRLLLARLGRGLRAKLLRAVLNIERVFLSLI